MDEERNQGDVLWFEPITDAIYRKKIAAIVLEWGTSNLVSSKKVRHELEKRLGHDRGALERDSYIDSRPLWPGCTLHTRTVKSGAGDTVARPTTGPPAACKHHLDRVPRRAQPNVGSVRLSTLWMAGRPWQQAP